jgi:signal transduction histidine kinase/ribosome-binding protein aMBF1 (putative translation factor)
MSVDARQSHVQDISDRHAYAGDETSMSRLTQASGQEDAAAGQKTPRSLGAVIAHRRRELGWSQQELAARVAAHGDAAFRQSDVSRLEHGKVGLPQRERLGHLAAVLDLPVGELLARAGWAGAEAAFAAEASRPRRGDSAPVTEAATAAPLPPLSLVGTSSPSDTNSPLDRYGEILSTYLYSPGEQALYEASLMSQTLVQHGVGPEEIVALHMEALDQALVGFTPREQARCVSHAHQFLLEVMIAYGLTYREYLELKVRERDAAAELAMQERTELLATVAHEMRTPLTAALGTIDLARRDLSKGRTDRVVPWLGTARDALRRLSRLTADIARASMGEPPVLNHAPHDLCQVVVEACAWAEAAAAEKGLVLVRESALPSVPVVGDADALLSVFGNLLANAIRYTPAGGRVTVSCAASDGQASVTVSDTGIGMSPEVQERIFEKFYRAREARGVEAQGLGLGLALVRELIEAHGGCIEVESAPGNGSTFCVLLPRGEWEGSE